MAEQIIVNQQAVSNILKKLRVLREESAFLLLDLDKSISNAELEGWSDRKYHQFVEDFSVTRNALRDTFRKLEEDYEPFLIKIIKSAEDY